MVLCSDFGCPVLDIRQPAWMWITAFQGDDLVFVTCHLVIAFCITISLSLASFGVPAGWLLRTPLLGINMDD